MKLAIDDLKAEIISRLPDNTTRQISEDDVRVVLTDIVDSLATMPEYASDDAADNDADLLADQPYYITGEKIVRRKGAGVDGFLTDINAGGNITIDKTDPQNPIISATVASSTIPEYASDDAATSDAGLLTDKPYYVTGFKVVKRKGAGIDGITNVFTNVMDYGATGDGVTDDTAAIEAAFAACLLEDKTVYFPIGTYHIRRGLIMQSGMKILGAKGATLTKDGAITQLIQANVTAGDTTVEVVDGSVYDVGQAFYLGIDSWDQSYQGTTGVITGISVNTITIEADRSTGIKNTQVTGATFKFTSAFAMLTTNSTKYGGSDILVDGLTFDPNVQVDEPISYSLAPLIFDPQSSTEPIIGTHINTVVRNVTILESATDGISFQNAGEVLVENCHIYNCVWKGIHTGTTQANTIIRGNYIKNCSEGAIFLCFGTNKTIIENNFITESAFGVFGIEFYDRNVIIRSNCFDNIVGYSVAIYGGAQKILISNNVFTNQAANNISKRVIDVDRSHYVSINNNLFTDWQAGSAGCGISFNNVTNLSIENNMVSGFIGTTFIFDSNLNGVSTNLIISGNHISGTGNGINLINSARSIISGNQINMDAGFTPLNIGLSCTDNVVNDNKMSGYIINNGIRTKFNGVTFEAAAPDILNYRGGDIVKDESSGGFFIASQNELEWNILTPTLQDAINYAYKDGVETITMVEGVNTGGSLSKEVDHLLLPSSDVGRVSAVTDTLVDLTSVSYIYADWANDGSTNVYNYSYFGVSTAKLTSEFDLFVLSKYSWPRQISKLDVSALSGNYYLKAMAYSRNVGYTSNLKVYKLGYK